MTDCAPSGTPAEATAGAAGGAAGGAGGGSIAGIPGLAGAAGFGRVTSSIVLRLYAVGLRSGSSLVLSALGSSTFGAGGGLGGSTRATVLTSSFGTGAVRVVSGLPQDWRQSPGRPGFVSTTAGSVGAAYGVGRLTTVGSAWPL